MSFPTREGAADDDGMRELLIPLGEVELEGFLEIPADAGGLVVFAHGSGSSRHSRRNQYVAQVLRDGGLGTLLFDLLSADEEAVDRMTRHLRFDIGLLGRRVVGAIDWLAHEGYVNGMDVGTFGSSTGAAAALIAAAERPDLVQAVVSRGGRPDLAESVLDDVHAPTLLIVGGEDVPVIGMNETALARLTVEKELAIVPGASHLFSEPGTLEQVAALAREWFCDHLSGEEAEA